MVDFFSSIFEFLFYIGSYAAHALEGLTSLVTFLLGGVVGINYIIGIVPSFISSALICFFGISIAKFVFGGWGK